MGKYLYCFIKENQKLTFGNSGIGNLNSPVYTINYKDISAVMSDAPMIEYYPKRKNLLAHQNIINKVMEKYTVIPVAFGTVAADKKDIETLIKNNYNSLIKTIDYLKDKMEVGLKVTWKKDKFNKDIENKDIKKLKEYVSGKDEEEVMTEKIQLGKLVESAIEEKRNEYTKNIYNPLKYLAAESKLKDKLQIKTVLNGYFLVKKSQEEEFDKVVGEIYEMYKDKLDFNYTGPWPPYNFIDINLNLRALKK